MREESRTTPERRRLWPGVALLVLSLAGVVLVFLLAVTRYEWVRQHEPPWLVGVGAIIAAIFLGLWTMFERRWPVAIPVVLAMLPWGIGLWTTQRELATTEIDFEYSMNERSTAIRALMGALDYDVIATRLTALLVGALGAALIVSAATTGARGRWWIAPIAAAPVLAAMTFGLDALDPLVLFGSLVVALALGVAAARAREPSAVAGALVLAVALLILVQACELESLQSAIGRFDATASYERAGVVTELAEASSSRDAALVWLLAGAGAGLAVLLGAAFPHVERSAAPIARAVAALSVVGLVVLAGRQVLGTRVAFLEQATLIPWAAEPGFEPTDHADGFDGSPPSLIVTRDRVVPARGAALPLSALDSADGRARMRALLRRFYAGGLTQVARSQRDAAAHPPPSPEELAERMRRMGPGACIVPLGVLGDPDGIRADREITMAVDRRLSMPRFRALLRAIADARYQRIEMIGLGPRVAARDTIEEQRFVRAIAARGPMRNAGFLENAFRGPESSEQVLFDGAVTDEPVLRLVARPGPESLPPGGALELRRGEDAEWNMRGAVAFLSLPDDASMNAVVRTLLLAFEKDLSPVLLAAP